MIDECIKDAKESKMFGVAVVTRKGSFMAKKDIFVKKGFVKVDMAEPDFQLMVLKFDPKKPNPKFMNLENNLEKYKDGFFILRSVQCPYTEKNVNAILKSARDKFGLEANLVDLEESTDVQNSPCAFGSFCIVHNGEIISYHPISNTRFENRMKKRV